MSDASHCDWLARCRLLPARTLLLAGLAVGIHLIPGAAELLQYDAGRLADGQIWRAVTGHLTHWSRDHLFWDVLMFVVLAGLAERRSVRAFWVCMGVSVTGMLLVLMLALPGIELYRGLSGLDSAFTALLGVTLLSERRRTEHGQPADWLVMLALAGLAGKMIYEAATGSAIFVPSQTETPLPLVHLAGAICGLVAGLHRRAVARGSAILAG